jgi:hypothetical protein
LKNIIFTYAAEVSKCCNHHKEEGEVEGVEEQWVVGVSE